MLHCKHILRMITSINIHAVIALMFSQTGTDVLLRRDEGLNKIQCHDQTSYNNGPESDSNQDGRIESPISLYYHYTTTAHTFRDPLARIREDTLDLTIYLVYILKKQDFVTHQMRQVINSLSTPRLHTTSEGSISQCALIHTVKIVVILHMNNEFNFVASEFESHPSSAVVTLLKFKVTTAVFPKLVEN